MMAGVAGRRAFLADCRLALLVGNEQLVRPEMDVGFAAQWNLQDAEHGFVEALARGDVLHHQLDVID